MNIVISNSSGQPIYEQIVSQIKALIIFYLVSAPSLILQTFQYQELVFLYNTLEYQ